MFVVTLYIAGVATPVALTFESEKEAFAVRDIMKAGDIGYGEKATDAHASVLVVDDKGHAWRGRPRDIVIAYVTDVAKDVAHQGDLQMIQMREQAKLQQRVQGDPILGLIGTLQAGAQSRFMS